MPFGSGRGAIQLQAESGRGRRGWEPERPTDARREAASAEVTVRVPPGVVQRKPEAFSGGAQLVLGSTGPHLGVGLS